MHMQAALTGLGRGEREGGVMKVGGGREYWESWGEERGDLRQILSRCIVYMHEE